MLNPCSYMIIIVAQVCICMDSKQPVKVTVIFRSQSGGKRIKAVEKKQYDPRVQVAWQKKAWADRNFCLDWAKHVFRRSTSSVDEKLLFLDNLDGQSNPEFVEYLQKHCNCIVRFGPAGLTDLWQPVDHHVGKLLKDYVHHEYEQLMEETPEKWEDGAISMQEKRVLVTKWVGAAWQRLCTEKPEFLIRAFSSTGKCNWFVESVQVVASP